MRTALILLVSVGCLAWIWVSVLRAREAALAAARLACRAHGLQFLDDSVSLAHVRPVRGPRGLNLRRVYEFEVSPDGTGRSSGSITLRGAVVESIFLPYAGEAPP